MAEPRRTGPVVLALTGSIGMGKSTTAAMFADEGVPVHDADATVHALYADRLFPGALLPELAEAFPGTVRDGAVDRAALGALVLGDTPEAKARLARLEALVHPLVRRAEAEFLARHAGAAVVLLDIPLLFETGGQTRVDGVVVVSAPEAVQRERVLARPGMSADKLDAILARQVPDADKRARADFVIETGAGLDAARDAVRAVLESVRSGRWRPRGETRR